MYDLNKPCDPGTYCKGSSPNFAAIIIQQMSMSLIIFKLQQTAMDFNDIQV